jgi:DNA-binding NarL/FixJ family response regulator
MITVGIVEDDHEIRKTIQAFLNRQDGFQCAVSYDSVEKLLNYLTKGEPPQVMIMDIGLPGMSGIDGIKLLKSQYPPMDIVVFSVYNDSQKIFDSLCAGATGYLLKNTPLKELKDGIRLLTLGGSPMSPQIARCVIEFLAEKKGTTKGESSLSDREKEIVVGLVDGLSYKLIADRMSITIETVRFHIKNIYKKLHVHCRSEVITKSLRGEI